MLVLECSSVGERSSARSRALVLSCSCSRARARTRALSCSCSCSSTRVLVSARMLVLVLSCSCRALMPLWQRTAAVRQVTVVWTTTHCCTSYQLLCGSHLFFLSACCCYCCYRVMSYTVPQACAVLYCRACPYCMPYCSVFRALRVCAFVVCAEDAGSKIKHVNARRSVTILYDTTHIRRHFLLMKEV